MTVFRIDGADLAVSLSLAPKMTDDSGVSIEQPPSQAPVGDSPSGDQSAPSGDAPIGAVKPTRYRMSPRSATMVVSCILTVIIVIAIAMLPVPYAVERPGPTFDTLGTVDGTDLITITGAKTYKTTGQLRFVTVSAVGGPGYPVSFPEVVWAWLDSSQAVVPVEELYPPGQTKQQSADQSNKQMTQSQDTATSAALAELGYPSKLYIQDFSENSASKGILEKGDIIDSINGVAMTSYPQLKTALGKIPAGTVVSVGITRGTEKLTKQVKTGAAEDGSSLLGVILDPRFDTNISVSYGVDKMVGGPSAGMMFSLAIIDKLTEEDEANGVIIAGTGTIGADGSVGAIGGIEQKMIAASTGLTTDGTDSADKATWFLAPASNCSDVVGNVPDGLHVVKVATLHEAREAMIAIGKGEGSSLATCTK